VLPRWLIWPVFCLVMGFVLGGSCFWGVYGPNLTTKDVETIQQHSTTAPEDAKPQSGKADEALALYTFWLTILTGLVALATCGLVAATLFLYFTGEKQLVLLRDLTTQQANDTRVLQRAYVSVLPRGIAPYLSTNERLACDVSFYNAGNLPAREVSWFIDKALSTDPHRKTFPVTEPFYGNNILPPKSEMRKGAVGTDTGPFERFIEGGRGDDRWLYVWGQVRYKDGFGQQRFTSFCHRYNLLGASNNTVPEENGRLHEYGTHTDEELAV
jgi:hypothetical protein